jgi:hypothetical protein
MALSFGFLLIQGLSTVLETSEILTDKSES